MIVYAGNKHPLERVREVKACSHNGILLKTRKERPTDMHNDTDEPQKHLVEPNNRNQTERTQTS